MSTQPQTSFAVNDRVRLDGLKKMSLNDTLGTILAWDEAKARYAVRLDDDKGDVRVRPENLKPITSEATPSATPTTSRQTKPTATDSTLFVNDENQFIRLSAVSAPPAAVTEAISSHDATTHRLPLPAGYWSVRFIEQDATARLVRVTLVAGEATAGAEDESSKWNQLSGLTVTREVLAAEDDDDVAAKQLTATVEGSTLIVVVPRALARAPARAVPEGDVVDVSVDKENAACLFENVDVGDLSFTIGGADDAKSLRRMRSAASATKKNKPAAGIRRMRSAGDAASTLRPSKR